MMGGNIRSISVYHGDDAVDHFIEELLKVWRKLAKKLNNVAPMNISAGDERNFPEATHSSICKKSLAQKRANEHETQKNT